MYVTNVHEGVGLGVRLLSQHMYAWGQRRGTELAQVNECVHALVSDFSIACMSGRVDTK